MLNGNTEPNIEVQSYVDQVPMSLPLRALTFHNPTTQESNLETGEKVLNRYELHPTEMAEETSYELPIVSGDQSTNSAERSPVAHLEIKPAGSEIMPELCTSMHITHRRNEAGQVTHVQFAAQSARIAILPDGMRGRVQFEDMGWKDNHIVNLYATDPKGTRLARVVSPNGDVVAHYRLRQNAGAIVIEQYEPKQKETEPVPDSQQVVNRYMEEENLKITYDSSRGEKTVSGAIVNNNDTEEREIYPLLVASATDAGIQLKPFTAREITELTGMKQSDVQPTRVIHVPKMNGDRLEYETVMPIANLPEDQTQVVVINKQSHPTGHTRRDSSIIAAAVIKSKFLSEAHLTQSPIIKVGSEFVLPSIGSVKVTRKPREGAKFVEIDITPPNGAREHCVAPRDLIDRELRFRTSEFGEFANEYQMGSK